MSEPTIFENDVNARLAAEALVVDVDGFEGPLDLLLTLSRTQKVDLRQISVLSLAEQYLAFIHKARDLRLELAADYLVMAAWLAFLKSRLLLPPDPTEEGPSGEELAAHLAFQLERLSAMRDAANVAAVAERRFFGSISQPSGKYDKMSVHSPANPISLRIRPNASSIV